MYIDEVVRGWVCEGISRAPRPFYVLVHFTLPTSPNPPHPTPSHSHPHPHPGEERYLCIPVSVHIRTSHVDEASPEEIVEAKERVRFIFNASTAQVWSYSERPVPVSEQHCARSKGRSVYSWRPEVIPLSVNILLAVKRGMSTGRHENYTSSVMIYLSPNTDLTIIFVITTT